MTVSDNTQVAVQNLVDHTVVFKDEELHQRIVFNPFEIKKLKAGMLRKLNYSYGGSVLLKDYLSVKNAELAREFGVSDDTIEYNWTAEDVEELLLHGDEDALLDALDFGPQGIVDLIIDKATELKINDVSKREAILEKTGVDINARIANQENLDKAVGKTEAPKKTTRRVTAKAEENTSSQRRKAVPVTE